MTESKPVAVVTGGAQGIGLASVERLAADGFHTVALDINGAKAESEAERLRAKGLSVEAAALDVRDRKGVAELFDRLPRLDVLFNNAGIFVEGDFLDLVEDDLMAELDVVLIGSFIVAQEAARRMPEGGRIINMSSRAFLGAPKRAPHVIAKAAMVGLTRAMAIDLMGRKISVNAIAPGSIDTDGVRAKLTPERLAQTLATQPTGSMGRPEDIANAVSFLASPTTGFLTGQVLFVDGGKSLGTGFGI